MSFAMVVDLTVHIDYEPQASPATIERVVKAIRDVVAAYWPHSDDASMHVLAGDQRAKLVARIWNDLAGKESTLESGNSYTYFQLRFPHDPTLLLCIWFCRYSSGSLGVMVGFATDQPRRIRGTLSEEGLEAEWLKELAKWGKVMVMSGALLGPPPLAGTSQEAVRAWWERYDRLPESPSIWKEHKNLLSPLVDALLKILPSSINSVITVLMDLGVSDVHAVVPLLIKALQTAVVENWQALSSEPTRLWPNFKRQFSTLVAERMITELEDSTDWNDGSSYSTIDFYFSPMYVREIEISVSRDADDSLMMRMALDGKAVVEVEGTAAQRKMLSEWQGRRGRTDFHFRFPGKGDMEDDELRKWQEEYDRLGHTSSIWPKHRQCLLNVVEHLKQSLLIRRLELDPRLLEPPQTSEV